MWCCTTKSTSCDSFFFWQLNNVSTAYMATVNVCPKTSCFASCLPYLVVIAWSSSLTEVQKNLLQCQVRRREGGIMSRKMEWNVHVFCVIFMKMICVRFESACSNQETPNCFVLDSVSHPNSFAAIKIKTEASAVTSTHADSCISMHRDRQLCHLFHENAHKNEL